MNRVQSAADSAGPCGAGPCPASGCPLCGAPNDCQLCTQAAYKGPCWCEGLPFPEELLARVPAEVRNRVCICRRCVETALRQRPQPRPGAGDFYFDAATGFVVFTAAYHRRRGYCCGSGCRHCPWSKREAGSGKSELAACGSQSTIAGYCGSVASPVLVAVCLLLLTCFPGWAQNVTEDFATDPATRGWQAFGNTNLFRWNAAEQRLDVTWDTANPHSFFALPLAANLATNDNFAVVFDLNLNDVQGGVRANRPGAMPLSLGFLNLQRALTNSYLRGAGRAKDTLEFTWFPAGEIPGFGVVDPTISAITWDSAGKVAASFTFPVEPATHTTFHVRLEYRAATRTITPTLSAGTEPVSLNPLTLPETFGRFDLDAFAVMVWNEATSMSDSLLAHGWIDNVVFELPPSPIGRIVLVGLGQVECASVRGWRYILEASGDLNEWTAIWSEAGTGGTLSLPDLRDAVFREQFYRVKAERE